MDIINHLLETSIYTVMMILIVVTIKQIFKERMSPTLHFVIWFLPIARLCIPFTIDSNIRLIVIPQETKGAIQTYGQLQSNAQLTWTDYFLVVWLFGMVFLVIRMIVNMIRMKHVIKINGIQPSTHMKEMLNLSRKELGIKKQIKLLMLPNVTTPALTIEFRPKIVMPMDIQEYLTVEQLELVMKHELLHYKRRDYLITMLLRLIEIVYWFNPAVWLMGWYLSLDMESACDSMVVRKLDSQLKKNYALSLVQLSSRRRMLKFVIGLIFGNNERNVEQRIRRVFQTGKRKTGMILVTFTMSVVMLIACFTTILHPVMKSTETDHKQIGDLTNNTAVLRNLKTDNSQNIDMGYYNKAIYTADSDDYDLTYNSDLKEELEEIKKNATTYYIKGDVDKILSSGVDSIDPTDPNVYTTDVPDYDASVTLSYVNLPDQPNPMAIVITKIK